MTYQANPMEAFGQMRNALQAGADDRTRLQAGRAYAGGDARGAANALASGGLSQEAADLEYRGQQREGLISEQERAAAAERTTALMRGLQALQGVPYEQRGQVWQQIAPMLSGIMPQEAIQQLGAADMSDESLSAFGAALGQEAERLQLFQFPNGGDIVGVSQRTGQERSRVAGPGPDPLEREYRQAQIDATRAQIPLREAQAARAARPPAPRGSGRSGGGSAPRTSAPASRPPWERF